MSGLERPSFLLGTYERHIVKAIEQYVKPGQVAYDIGAHIGYLSLVLSKAVGSNGRVYAFEPDERNLFDLQTTIRANARENVTIVPMAVSSSNGPVAFATFNYTTVSHIATSHTPGDASITKVSAVSIDEFIKGNKNRPPNFIKIDVEGGEGEVIQGAMHTIEEHKPIIVVEVRSGQRWQGVLQIMTAAGYTSRILNGSVSVHEDGQLADVLFVPPARH